MPAAHRPPRPRTVGDAIAQAAGKIPALPGEAQAPAARWKE